MNINELSRYDKEYPITLKYQHGGQRMIYILVATIIFAADVAIKSYIEKNKKINEEEEILKGRIIVTRYHNKGAMLNLLEKNTRAVIVISGCLFGAVLTLFGMVLPKNNPVLKTGLSLLIGGASSNLYDRVKKGYVVDYFSFRFLKKIVFNIGDLFIMLGSTIVGIYMMFKKK